MDRERFHELMGTFLTDYSLNSRGEYDDNTTHLAWVAYQLGFCEGSIDELKKAHDMVTQGVSAFLREQAS